MSPALQKKKKINKNETFSRIDCNFVIFIHNHDVTRIFRCNQLHQVNIYDSVLSKEFSKSKPNATENKYFGKISTKHVNNVECKLSNRGDYEVLIRNGQLTDRKFQGRSIGRERSVSYVPLLHHNHEMHSCT